MTLPPTDIARRICDTFPADRQARVETVIAEVLRADGWGAFAASDEAAQKLFAVVAALDRIDVRERDFVLHEGPPPRLVGKTRAAVTESDEVRRIRLLSTIETKRQVLQNVYDLGPELFVGVAIRIMLEHKAASAYGTGNSDEGGIDLYGRLPLRLQDPSLPAPVLRTTPLTAELLFLGQCKCYRPDGPPLGPNKMDEFDGALRRCLSKYEGPGRKPSKRVPEDFYRKDETALGIYFTTTSFTSGAYGARRDLILVNGMDVAEFLIAQEIGVRGVAREIALDVEGLRRWAEEGLVFRAQA